MKVGICNRNLWSDYLANLGILGIFTSFGSIFITIDNDDKTTAGVVFLLLLLIIYIVMLLKANRLNSVNLNVNGLEVNIFYGDIFDSEGLKLIPFNEYFDTLVDNVIIAEKSLNGKFINYYSNQANLDEQIARKLERKQPKVHPSRELGKKESYELGTTIEIENDFLLTAFTHFDEENRAYLSKGEYLLCLDNLWKEVNRIYAQRNVSIPLLGSGITRVGNELKLQDYLEQILNSLRLSNLDSAHDTRISIVLHKSISDEINLFDIKSRFK
ncbi:TPA: hypothetical protein I7148_21485 [Vibrio vulnificus]|nr:hypothetical protein [Vibrio vulnificus]